MKLKDYYLVLLLIAVALSVASCKAISSARKAQDPRSAQPGERTIRAFEVGLGEGQTLTLEKALKVALSYHPSIVKSRQKLKIAEARLQQACSGFRPQITTSASYSKATSNLTNASKTNKSSDSYSASISLNQLLFDFGKTRATIRQAHKETIAAHSDLRTTENNIAFSVRCAYYDFIKQKALVNVAKETVRQYEKRLEQAKGLFEVGARIKYDVTKARVDLGNARLKLVSAKNALRINRAVLNNVIGLAEEPKYIIKEPKEIKEFKYSFDDLIKEARKNHPELQAQIARVESCVASIDRAIANLFPSLSLQGGYRWSGREFPLVWNWSYGTTLIWNLFTGFRASEELKEAVANLRYARTNQAELEQRIYLDVCKAVAQIEDAKERLSLANLIVKHAQENLTLVQGRYKIGKASSVELTDAQVALSNAKGEKVQARFDYQTSIAFLKKSIGKVQAPPDPDVNQKPKPKK